MSSIENDLNSFNVFVKTQVTGDLTEPSIDELFDAWRIQNPPESDLLAIRASLKDLDAGERGKSIEEFNQQMAEKYKLS